MDVVSTTPSRFIPTAAEPALRPLIEGLRMIQEQLPQLIDRGELHGVEFDIVLPDDVDSE